MNAILLHAYLLNLVTSELMFFVCIFEDEKTHFQRYMKKGEHNNC